MKILLVEDSATLRFAMDAYIREAGHETVIAENGEKAVQIIDQMQIDMVVMDVEMPGLDGFETTRLIRESLAEHWIPIIFVTGKSEEKSLEEGIAVGGDDYLIKPISKVILKAKIAAMERIANMRSQLHRLNEELKRLSQRDSLTHLYNRRTFEEKATEAWRTATRNKQPLAILLLDIDFFKRYNDTYGHLAGDDCIVNVAQTLSSQFNRAGDVVARYGGEEFIVLLPDTDRIGATHVAEQLIRAIYALDIPHSESPEYKRVTVSVGGCALKYTTGADLQQIISSADRSLYLSKRQGRNRSNISDFTNLHKVLLIDKDPVSFEQINSTLEGHCDLSVIQEEDDMHLAENDSQAELVIVNVENESDEVLDIYRKLSMRIHLNEAPLLLLSSLNKNEIKEIGKELGANGTLRYPIDGHQLIAKIDQFLGTK